MQRITTYWQSGLVGKIVLSVAGLFGLMLLCCVGIFAVAASQPNRPTPTAIAAQPLAAIEATNVPKPTAALTPTATPRTAPTEAPKPTQAPTATAVATSGPIPKEPSRGLGMSRAAWEAKAGAPISKGGIGERYKNGAEITFLNDVAWMIHIDFPDKTPLLSADAHGIGKLYIPNDAKLVKTYERNETMVHLYHSEWLKSRYPDTIKVGDTSVSLWTEGKPGDFTLQYNVFKGKVYTIILALGNNP